jgi:methionyl-tRNA formyltransferase
MVKERAFECPRIISLLLRKNHSKQSSFSNNNKENKWREGAVKIVFMGTPEFAVPTLERLLASQRHRVEAVVTQPDKPAGRGKKLQPPPVKEVALAHGLPVLQPQKIRGMNFDNVLRPFSPDIIVVVAYGKILPPEILQLPPFGCVNLHASLLPKYRGAAPIQWAIINGKKFQGSQLCNSTKGWIQETSLPQKKLRSSTMTTP